MKGSGRPRAGQARKELDKINSTRPIIKYCPACASDGSICGYYKTDRCPHRGGALDELHRIFTEKRQEDLP
jgi:hypothetical protein